MTINQADQLRSILDLETLLEIVQESFTPDEVFDVSQLEEWASENGWKKDENETKE